MYLCVFVFFFNQNTAYDMRISDWSSDVCSSDLQNRRRITVDRGPDLGGDLGQRHAVDRQHLPVIGNLVHRLGYVLGYSDSRPSGSSRSPRLPQPDKGIRTATAATMTISLNALKGTAPVQMPRHREPGPGRCRRSSFATRPTARG